MKFHVESMLKLAIGHDDETLTNDPKIHEKRLGQKCFGDIFPTFWADFH